MGKIASLKEWELRALVLLSLTLQTILFMMGNRRKYINNIWITILVWFPYLIADAVATTALGFIARNMYGDDGDLDANIELHAFWAPFLLLHLGGPDTITAYSLEDNGLWSRHMLHFIVQTVFAFYIFVTTWTGTLLSFLSIPMLFAGILKYGERSYVLWSASYEQRRLSESIEGLTSFNVENISFRVEDEDDDNLISVAYGYGKLTKWFFLDMVIDQYSSITLPLETIIYILAKMSPINALKTIEMELGFMYDELYTKAMLTHIPWGFVLRLASFLPSCIVLFFFSVSYHKQKHYSQADLYTTFLLLTVAVFLELYAALVALSSNQSIAWLTTHKTRNFSKAIISSLWLFRNPMWSNRMGQFSMLSYFFQEKSKGFRRLLLSCLPKRCHKISYISELEGNLERQEYESYQKVPEHLKLFLFRCFLEYMNVESECGSMRSTRGRISLELNGYDSRILNMDADLSVTVWHVVTELSYHLDADCIKEIKSGGNGETGESVYDDIGLCYEISMYISKYMMHLLVFSPHLFPTGGLPGEARLRNTVIVGRQLVKYAIREGEGTRKAILQSISDRLMNFPPSPGISRCGVEFHEHVHNLLRLFRMDSSEEKEVERKWKTICGIWVELLAHISTECTGNQHAQLLRQGGELLTHVALLMAHLGLTKHFPFLLARDSCNLS